MSIYEMHLMIQQRLQKNGVFAGLSVEHDEIDLQIKAEMLLMIDDVIRNVDKPQDGYDKDTINLSALKNIYVHRAELGSITPVTTPTGSKRAVFPGTMYLPIRVWAELTYTCNGTLTTKKSRCRLVDADKADDLIDHVIFKPTAESPVAFVEKNNVHVLTDGGFTITKIYLDYLEEFAAPVLALNEDGSYNAGGSTQCVFHQSIHQKLVERTAATLKSLNEGNPNVVRRIDMKESLN